MEKEWEDKGVGETNIGKIKIKALKYADDIAVIAEDPKSLNKMMEIMGESVERQKLVVNTKKTKVVVFRNGGGVNAKLNPSLRDRHPSISAAILKNGVQMILRNISQTTRRTENL
ncbi:hypothetical protein PV326_013477 [Microctonus aethiopoides]|nr:hypothetical protein PV326_013477 [Microctonus aethiopoides]